jgi:uncharacterized iron-regulated protein
VVLGEVHDNPVHHANQALVIEAMRPAALVFEMLTPAQAEAVTADVRDDPAALSAALGWAESGWPDFEMYYPIFAAAPDAAIYGAALPRDAVRRAATDGAAAIFGPGAGVFGIDAALPEAELEARTAEQGAAHCDAIPVDQLPGMVEGQRLRDAAFARTTLEAFDATGGPVAVITGNGHARTDRGIPAMIAAARPELEVLAIGQLEAPPNDVPSFDLWVITDAVDRDDPCEAFR